MPHIPGRPNEGHGKPTAQSVLTSPNDLDLGMQEFLASLGTHPDPNYVPPSAATVQGIKSDWITNQFPIGSGVNPAADANWQNMIDVQQHQFLPGAPDLTSLYQPGDFGAPPPPPTIQGATQTAHQYLMENQQPARTIVEELFPATVKPWQPVGYTSEGIAEGGFDPTSADAYRLGSPVSMQAVYEDAMMGDGSSATNFYEDLVAAGDSAAAEDFRIAYREENGIDPATIAGINYENIRPFAGVPYYDFDDPRKADFYDSLGPAERERFNILAEKRPDASAESLHKDFKAIEHFLTTLPSKEQRVEKAAAEVTQADVDAYMKQLDAMPDEEYNALVTEMGLSADHFKVDGKKPWEREITSPEGVRRTGESGTGTGEVDVAAYRSGMGGGLDADSVFNADMERIVKAVAEAQEACLAGGGTWGVNGCEIKEEEEEEETDEETDEEADVDQFNLDDEITRLFDGLNVPHLEGDIRRRMDELGTTDLTQLIRDEFATITTPDYAADILTAHEGMRTAVSDAALARSEQLEASTTRAEGRIAEIKSTLTGELADFEVGRVEQQTALNQKVIDRTTDMELALTERLADIRTELGDQVTDEFESMAALAETMVSSQATSSRDAMTRLGQISDMAAQARLSAPVELSAEALTALSDLEFQIESQIAQSKEETIAQINIEEASALLQETMRQGGFETTKQQALVEATLNEKLRGTVYEDRVSEMMAQALMAEDQYVRQFGADVDMAEAQAKLQNLFGTQDYQRQLDMMNLTRTWQVADTLQSRDWQTTDVSQARGWQVSDQEMLRDQYLTDQTTARTQQLADQGLARQQQLSDMAVARGWQETDYLTALGDQRADELRRRGWQTEDIDEANLWQLAMATQDRDWQLADALAASAVGDDPLSKMKDVYPNQEPGLYAAAMQIGRMSDERESVTSWEKEDPRVDNPDFDGLVKKSTTTINGEKVDRYFVTEYGGQSQAEAYLRSLGEGTLMGPPNEWGSQAERTPALSAQDYAALRALSDMARLLIAAEDDALERKWVDMMKDTGTTDIYGGSTGFGTGRYDARDSQSTKTG